MAERYGEDGLRSIEREKERERKKEGKDGK